MNPFTRLGGLLALVLGALAVQAEEAALDPDTVLMRRGDIQVTVRDWRAYLRSVQDDLRAQAEDDFVMSARFLDSLWTWKVLAADARAAGLDERADVQADMAWAAERALGRAWLVEAERTAPDVDLEAQAREYWLLHPDDYRVPDQLDVSHILIEPAGECEDDVERARALAREVHARAAAGEDFAALAREYSDDASAVEGGALGPQFPDRWVPPFREAAEALEEPGDISEPVRTRFGFHVIRLNERIPGRPVPYDEVREGLLEHFEEENRQRWRQRRIEAARDMTGRELNVEALRTIMPLGQVSPAEAFERVREEDAAREQP